MIFAEKLIQLRKKSGWSQEELAEQMNVTRQSVSKWEGAQSVPDLNKMIQLSRLFNVSLDYLLKDEIEEMPEQEEAPPEDKTGFRRNPPCVHGGGQPLSESQSRDHLSGCPGRIPVRHLPRLFDSPGSRQ